MSKLRDAHHRHDVFFKKAREAGFAARSVFKLEEIDRKLHLLRPGTRVLYVTGYTRNAIIHHGRLDPDIDLLTKPFTAEALTRKVRQILDGPRVERQAGS